MSTTAPQTGSSWTSFLFLGAMLVAFYFLILRPQRARMKAQQQLASSLEIGDRVQTIGGVQGTITALDADSVVIEVEQGRIRFTRRAIATKVDNRA